MNKTFSVISILAILLASCPFNSFAQNSYSFKVNINWQDSITVEDANLVPTGITEGTFSFSDLLANAYNYNVHSMQESANFDEVSFTLQLPTGFESLGCNVLFVDNSPSPLAIFKRGNRLSMSFIQGYSAFHGSYKLICF
ncbi:hypothetical protein [Pseudoalteromonas luteoviolacea]|uniref:hypothetical protein n=1 Tax=Pseudoalteromonas luteoviolacea TaxID=43657 RepID=UPI001B3646B7|nr:hypothetical protein [Pseudoalteromonas luteoviolacea]MBQ4836537.1 hypothetical protein [Pseudoalteromonas luteoviolacea]